MNVVLFPSESFRPKKIDPHFEAEEAGHARFSSVAVLPDDAARHDELTRIRSAARRTAADRASLVRGDFDRARIARVGNRISSIFEFSP